jgi:hypothetical protein
MAVGVQPQPDPEEEKIFRALVSRNALNMHAPAYAVGVIAGGQPAGHVRQTIQGLLGKVGVRQ